MRVFFGLGGQQTGSLDHTGTKMVSLVDLKILLKMIVKGRFHSFAVFRFAYVVVRASSFVCCRSRLTFIVLRGSFGFRTKQKSFLFGLCFNLSSCTCVPACC